MDFTHGFYEAAGRKKSRTDIANLSPEYNYQIELYAKTSAGQGTIPARINATTISIDAARPLTPINVTISQDNVPSGVNISWIYSQQSQFMPDNYTLNVRPLTCIINFILIFI